MRNHAELIRMFAGSATCLVGYQMPFRMSWGHRLVTSVRSQECTSCVPAKAPQRKPLSNLPTQRHLHIEKCQCLTTRNFHSSSIFRSYRHPRNTHRTTFPDFATAVNVTFSDCDTEWSDIRTDVIDIADCEVFVRSTIFQDSFLEGQ